LQQSRSLAVKIRACKSVTLARSTLDLALFSSNGFIGRPRLRLKVSSQGVNAGYITSGADLFIEFDIKTTWVPLSASELIARKAGTDASIEYDESDAESDVEDASSARSKVSATHSLPVLSSGVVSTALAPSRSIPLSATTNGIHPCAISEPSLKTTSTELVVEKQPVTPLDTTGSEEPDGDVASSSEKANNPFDELLQTERGFLSDLELMIECVVRPLKAQNVIPGIPVPH
jgi:hypothetical protein